jgi:transposase InsO family protein
MFLLKEPVLSGERRNVMAFWNRSKKQKEEASAPIVVRRGKGNSGNRFPVEVKVLAARAKESGLDRKEVADLIGASLTTVDKWCQMYQEGGPEALVNQSTSPSTRRICKELERRIEARRRENPEAGVRRIRDELRREEGVAVSAETVRRVINDAGLSNTPPVTKRNPPQERRFEREVPNAMWQIDIFTFELKRMYRVYLVGLIDDHSRYIVGHGLFRQQTADAVLEVVRGAIGQWGAPRDILSDNGRQFVAWRGKTKFQKVLRRQGVQHVRSAPHHPMTLGKIERFWRTIWEEFLSDAVFASFADASQRLAHWIAYYNHQRPHQGIGGACPADRFYGITGDVEEALKQGCAENALRLALGQETRQPLYLLGKLGETDVRVTRKGDDIEVKVGDVIHEMIRMGAPYEVDENGLGKRGGETDEMEGHDGAGAVPGGGDGSEGGEADHGDLPDVCSEPADVELCDGEGIGSGDAVAGAEEARQEGQECGGAGDHGADKQDDWFAEDSGALEDEV